MRSGKRQRGLAEARLFRWLSRTLRRWINGSRPPHAPSTQSPPQQRGAAESSSWDVGRPAWPPKRNLGVIDCRISSQAGMKQPNTSWSDGSSALAVCGLGLHRQPQNGNTGNGCANNKDSQIRISKVEAKVWALDFSWCLVTRCAGSASGRTIASLKSETFREP